MSWKHHKHKWVPGDRGGLLQLIACRLKGCDASYLQGLLFDPTEYQT